MDSSSNGPSVKISTKFFSYLMIILNSLKKPASWQSTSSSKEILLKTTLTSSLNLEQANMKLSSKKYTLFWQSLLFMRTVPNGSWNYLRRYQMFLRTNGTKIIFIWSESCLKIHTVLTCAKNYCIHSGLTWYIGMPLKLKLIML